MDYVFLTRAGYDRLVDRFEFLTRVRRRELARAIEKARSFGDLSENAEYDAAKEAQANNEHEIAELESTLSRARLIENEGIATDEVRVGALVSLRDLDTEENICYTMVSEAEANYTEGKISLASPVGKALLGHKKDEVVTIEVPAGTLRYKIVAIARP